MTRASITAMLTSTILAFAVPKTIKAKGMTPG